jgi:broad specificity phosphatase PhoE
LDHDKRRLYLVRHAESVWNAERKVQGTCPGILLSDHGREQARLLGNRLREIEAEAVYCSDAERAVETARLALGNGRKITLMQELRELSLGEWEGRSIVELCDKESSLINRWYREPTQVRVKGAEDLFAFRDRIVRTIESIVETPDGGNAIVVTHGGVICAYLTHILGMSLDDLWTFSLPNASITTIILDFRPRLRAFGDTAHLTSGACGFNGISSSG